MNREILFRAKRVDNNEWVEGDLIQLDSRIMIADKGMSAYDRGNTHEHISIECVEIKPETVGQFTGLTYKNGVKIFEGDIVAHFDLENKKQIIFKNGAFGYMTADGYDFISYSENRHNFDFRDNNSCFIEVIGNIHDNPELLK